MWKLLLAAALAAGGIAGIWATATSANAQPSAGRRDEHHRFWYWVYYRDHGRWIFYKKFRFEHEAQRAVRELKERGYPDARFEKKFLHNGGPSFQPRRPWR